jgi:hypothetical protein
MFEATFAHLGARRLVTVLVPIGTDTGDRLMFGTIDAMCGENMADVFQIRWSCSLQ